jgi:hypothetical protein
MKLSANSEFKGIMLTRVKWTWRIPLEHGSLDGLIIDNENIPLFQLPHDHFDAFLQAAIHITGIGAVPGHELLNKSL